MLPLTVGPGLLPGLALWGPGPAGGVGAPEPPLFTPRAPETWHGTRELDTHGWLAGGTPVGSLFGTTTPLRPGMPPTVVDPF